MSEMCLNISDLKSGMILSQDILNDRKEIIISEGIMINDDVREKLFSMFGNIRVYVVADMGQYTSRQRIKKVEEAFQKITDKLEGTFSHFKEDQVGTITEVYGMGDDLVNELSDYKMVFESIVDSNRVDQYLYRHSINVSILSVMLAKWMGLKEEQVIEISRAGLLHDIGKMVINQEVLHKPGKLTEEEFKEMKKHVSSSYEIIKNIEFISEDIKEGVYSHHEKEDGSGYPRGLKGDEIPLYGKIMALADIFDAMTSNRVYRKMESPFKVMEMFERESFGKLDPRCLMVFLEHIGTYYEGENVLLSDGRIATIRKVNAKNRSKPLIQIENEFIDLSKMNDLEIVKLSSV